MLSIIKEDYNVDIPPNRLSVFRSTLVKPYLKSKYSKVLSDDEDKVLLTLELELILRRRGRLRKNLLL